MTDTLLFLHLLSAFALVAGAVTAGILHTAALRRDRPGEIALLLRASRPAVILVSVGAVGALVFGALLANHLGDDFGDAWITAALVLWVVAVVTGGRGGRATRDARELAERLAADGDRPSDELRARLRDRRTLALNYVSGLAILAIIVLMVFKPGG